MLLPHLQNLFDMEISVHNNFHVANWKHYEQNLHIHVTNKVLHVCLLFVRRLGYIYYRV